MSYRSVVLKVSNKGLVAVNTEVNATQLKMDNFQQHILSDVLVVLQEREDSSSSGLILPSL